MTKCSTWNTSFRKPVSSLEFAAIDLRHVPIDPCVAIPPAQVKIRSQRESNRLSIDLGLNRDPFRRAWHGEVQRLAENHRVGSAHHGVKHLSLQAGGPAYHARF